MGWCHEAVQSEVSRECWIDIVTICEVCTLLYIYMFHAVQPYLTFVAFFSSIKLPQLRNLLKCSESTEMGQNEPKRMKPSVEAPGRPLESI